MPYDIWTRARGAYIRRAAHFFYKRKVSIKTDVPIISFTFDDFPSSALQNGGAILKRHGLRGTYYASLGLMDKEAPAGRIFSLQDLKTLLEEGHELGCHTFDHYNSAKTNPGVYEDSILLNQRTLSTLFPGTSFKTFSYPNSDARPGVKQGASRHFVCCRGGDQRLNFGTADLNYLSAYFIEKSRDRPEEVRDLIERNRQVRGWLILATHDVREEPSRWGCTPKFFESVVQQAVSSGARILPVIRAWEALQSGSAQNPK